MSSGLVFVPVPDESAFLVRDFRTGLRMKLGAPERILCGLLDGSRSVSELADSAGERLSRAVSPDAVTRFVARLESAGALETSALGPSTHGRPALLVLSEVDAVFAALARRLRLLYDARVQGLLLVGVLCAGALAFRTLSPRLFLETLGFSLAQWSVFLCIEALALLAHEAAHGVTLRHFGGRTGNVAVGVRNPISWATVDVTAIRGLPHGWQRAAVLLSGAWVHLLMGSALVALRWWHPEGSWGALAGVSALIQYVHAFVALLPVVESDGYHLLAAWSGVPNLRLVSTQLVRALWKGPAFERHAELSLRPTGNLAICIAFAAATILYRVAVAAALLVGVLALMRWRGHH